jgi:hypothetical protein
MKESAPDFLWLTDSELFSFGDSEIPGKDDPL